MTRFMIGLIGTVIASSLLLVYLTLNSGYEPVQASNKPEVRYVQIGKWKCPDTALVTLTGEPFPPVRVPTYIPEGFRPIDCYYYQGSDLNMFFLYESVDPNNIPEGVDATDLIARNTIFFGAVWYGAEHMKEGKEEIIDRGVEFFKEYKESVERRSQKGDLIKIFEINGNPAMGWEMGNKNSIVMLDDKIISSEPVPYPAAIVMIDQKEQVYYNVRGYLPLEELKKILESLEKP